MIDTTLSPRERNERAIARRYGDATPTDRNQRAMMARPLTPAQHAALGSVDDYEAECRALYDQARAACPYLPRV